MSISRLTALLAAALAGFSATANAEFQTISDAADVSAASSGASFLSGEGTPALPGTSLSPGDPLPGGAVTELEFVAGPDPFALVVGFFRQTVADGQLGIIIDDALGIGPYVISNTEFEEFGVLLPFAFEKIKFVAQSGTSFEAKDFRFAYYADSVVPEPASATLFGLGALGLLGYGARRRKKLVV